jgi:hypothetical protein
MFCQRVPFFTWPKKPSHHPERNMVKGNPHIHYSFFRFVPRFMKIGDFLLLVIKKKAPLPFPNRPLN